MQKPVARILSFLVIRSMQPKLKIPQRAKGLSRAVIGSAEKIIVVSGVVAGKKRLRSRGPIAFGAGQAFCRLFYKVFGHAFAHRDRMRIVLEGL